MVFGADFVPPRPSPERLVNNLSKQFPNLLNHEEEIRLEAKLDDFNNSSSNQIAIVIVDSLNGREVNEFSTALFNTWGIGQKKNNNGVLILVKPTTIEGGRKVYISTGYGLEAVLPDVSCKQIIDNDITPRFKRGEYYAGLDTATTRIMALALHEFNKNTVNEQEQFYIALLTVLLIFAFLFFIRRSSLWRTPDDSYNISRRGYHRYYPSGFSSAGFGSGFSSSSGGSFSGGFGGGFSGGGGAGGSW